MRIDRVHDVVREQVAEHRHVVRAVRVEAEEEILDAVADQPAGGRGQALEVFREPSAARARRERDAEGPGRALVAQSAKRRRREERPRAFRGKDVRPRELVGVQQQSFLVERPARRRRVTLLVPRDDLGVDHDQRAVRVEECAGAGREAQPVAFGQRERGRRRDVDRARQQVAAVCATREHGRVVDLAPDGFQAVAAPPEHDDGRRLGGAGLPHPVHLHDVRAVQEVQVVDRRQACGAPARALRDHRAHCVDRETGQIGKRGRGVGRGRARGPRQLERCPLRRRRSRLRARRGLGDDQRGGEREPPRRTRAPPCPAGAACPPVSRPPHRPPRGARSPARGTC